MNKMIRAVIALAILGLFSAQSFAQIRVNEVGYNGVDFEGATKWVELYNAGDTEVDISGLILCEPPAYPTLGALTALAGSTTIPAGGYLVVAWSDIGDTDAEVGLYAAGTTNFADENTILDYMQFGNAGHAREVPAVAAGVWTAGEFVPHAEAGMSLQFVDNGTVGSGNWVAAAPTPNASNEAGNEGIADIRINEIGYNGVDFESAARWVELYNAGDTDVDVSNLILCDPPAYPVINTMTVLAGELVIPAGGYLVVAWPELGDGDGEVGLYKENSFGAFGSADNVLDYMQYGSADHTREAPAVEAGVWATGEFVAAADAGLSLQFVDNGTVGAGNWVAAAPTPNAVNEAGNEGIADIRINEIGYNGVDFESAARWVELYNAGDTDVDVSNLILCDPPAYPVINTMTVLAGELVIPAGGYLVVAWPELGDGDGEVGLYKENSFGAFGSADNVLDYMQYGSADHTREAPAVEAGVWATGEFVAAADAGLSLQFVDNGTVGSGNWIAAAATPNAENNTSTSNEAFSEVPGAFRLHANFPNPFNPTTTISYELNKVGQVSLSVFDMLGKKVADLYEGAQAVGSYSVSWDGRDERGITVSSGVYFYRLTLDGRVSTSRIMTLLK